MAEIWNLVPSEAVTNGSMTLAKGPDGVTLHLRTAEQGWVLIRCTDLEAVRIGAMIISSVGDHVQQRARLIKEARSWLRWANSLTTDSEAGAGDVRRFAEAVLTILNVETAEAD